MKKLIYILFLFPFLAQAAPGDRLFVAEEIAYLHKGPGAEHVVILKVQKNQELVELNIADNWVHVAVPGGEGKEGWIPLSDVSVTRILEIPLDAASPKFEQFKLEVLTLDDMVKSLVVRGLYGKIENRGNGTVFVGVSNTWLNFTPKERAANLKYLMYLWEKLHKPGTKLTVQLVDARGQKLMKTSLNRR